MKGKIIIYIILNLFVLSCKTNRNTEQDDIIELNSFSEKNYYKYIDKIGYHIANDSFKAILYSNVKPLKENEKIPQKIFGRGSYWNDSKIYFQKELKGKSLSYLEKNNKVVFRNFYYDYSVSQEKNINKPTNINELRTYLNSKKVNYKIIRVKKKSSSDIIDVEIQNQLYRIVLNNGLCESYLFYNKRDTINFDAYKNIVINFYW